MNPSTLPTDCIAIDRLRLRVPGGAAERARAALQTAPWPTPVGEDWVIVRALAVRAPVSELGARAAAGLADLRRTAVAAGDPAAERAGAVRFSDQAELIARLCADLAAGRAAGRWYWRHWAPLLRNSSAEAIRSLLGEVPERLTTVTERLARIGALPLVWQALSPAQAADLYGRLAAWLDLALPTAAAASRDARVTDLPTPPVALRQRWAPALAGMAPRDPRRWLAACLVALEWRPLWLGPGAAGILEHLAAALDAAPEAGRSEADSPWSGAAPPPGLDRPGLAPRSSSPPAAGSAAGADGVSQPLVPGLGAVDPGRAGAGAPRIDPQPRVPATAAAAAAGSDALGPEAARPGADRRWVAAGDDRAPAAPTDLVAGARGGPPDDPAGSGAAPGRDGDPWAWTAPARSFQADRRGAAHPLRLRECPPADRNADPNGPVGADRPAPASPAARVITAACPAAPRCDLETDEGGLFYLINFLARPPALALIAAADGFTQVPDGWAWLWGLGRSLGLRPDGTLAYFLAERIGLADPAHLLDLPPLPAAAVLLDLAERLYGSAQVWGPSLLAVPAGVRHSPSHLDVHYPLAAVRLAVRLAGLDVNPGWVPWLGRVVTLHYDGGPASAPGDRVGGSG